MPKIEIDFPKRMDKIPPIQMKKIVDLSIEEDIGREGDITSRSILGRMHIDSNAVILAKEEGVICGTDIVKYVYSLIDKTLKLDVLITDGSAVKSKDIIIKIEGNAGSITRGERTALNFLGLLSGVSTKVNRLTGLIKNYNTKLLDTRKTIPGLRALQKYAVYKGGGFNHRIGLYDMILIKENHITSSGGITNAVSLAKAMYPGIVIETEVETLDQVKEALQTKTDIIMLDDMDNETVKKALLIIDNEKYVEVSGNVDEKRLVELAQIGVDYVSMGALTHTVKPLDISLLIETANQRTKSYDDLSIILNS